MRKIPILCEEVLCMNEVVIIESEKNTKKGEVLVD